jgi:hypothetical protein
MLSLGRAGLLITCAIITACFDVGGAFRCDQDSQCDVPGLSGTCDDHACSYPQPTCVGVGRQYGANAGALAGTCVGTDAGPTLDAGSSDQLTVADGPLGTDGGPGGCTRPYLMVATEDQTPPGSAIGRVLRFSIDGSGSLHPCDSLTGNGSLGSLPQAVTWVPPRSVAVAARDATYLLDEASDAVLWSYPNPSIGEIEVPFDVIPIVEPVSGETRVAIGLENGSSTIYEIYVYRDAVSTPLHWVFNTDLAVSEPYSFTQRMPPTSHFWALVDGMQESMDVDPFNKTTNNYVGVFGGTDIISTIYEVDVAGVRRTVWIGSSTNSIYYLDDHGAGSPSPGGPVKCASASCNFVHAVPDPTTTGAYFVLCEDAGGNLNAEVVLRVTTAGACMTVYDGHTALDTNKRMVHLAVAPP